MTAEETAAAEGANRTLVILLGVAGGLALLALLWVFVISPLLVTDEVDEPIVRVPPPVPEEPEVPPAPEPTPVPETFEVFTARDPFQQLALPIVAAPVDPDAPADPDAPPPDPTRPPSDPDAPDPDAPPDAEVGATRVRLVDVFVDDDGVQKVLVTVNGTGFEVAAADEFAGRFRVLDISPPCATFLFGDSRFVLCLGEEIRK